jgi:hypothetical protein
LDPPYAMINELTERPSVAEANKLLNQGWVLIKSAELLRVDDRGHQATTIIYILGHIKEKRRSSTIKPKDVAATSSTTELQRDESSQAVPPGKPKTESVDTPPTPPPNMLSLPIQWRQKKDLNPNFFYAFTYGLDGELDPIVSSVVNAIKLSNGGTIEQGGWKFTVSKDGKFLQRSRHAQVKVVSK